MAIKRKRKAAETEEKPQKVKQKTPLPPLTLLTLTNMEPMKLEICWTPEKKKEFRTAKLYEFIYRSHNLPPIDTTLVEEYVRNYDPDGSSVVSGRIVAIDNVTLQKVLHLPIYEIPVGVEASSVFKPNKYFKNGAVALDKSQGWRTMDAISPELGEWKRFVLGRLSLKSHTTYLAKRLMYTIIGMLNGMVFDWVAFVAGKIHGELVTKRKAGRFASLLSSNYVYAVICHTLGLLVLERCKGPISVPQLLLARMDPLPQVRTVASLTGPGEASGSQGREEAPVTLDMTDALQMTTNLEQDIVIQVESNELVAQHANDRHNVSLKDSLLTHLAQLKRMVDQLEGEGDWKGQLEASEKEDEEYRRRVSEQAIMLAEKADSIIALGDYHKKKEATLLKERDAAREAVEA